MNLRQRTSKKPLYKLENSDSDETNETDNNASKKSSSSSLKKSENKPNNKRTTKSLEPTTTATKKSTSNSRKKTKTSEKNEQPNEDQESDYFKNDHSLVESSKERTIGAPNSEDSNDVITEIKLKNSKKQTKKIENSDEIKTEPPTSSSSKKPTVVKAKKPKTSSTKTKEETSATKPVLNNKPIEQNAKIEDSIDIMLKMESIKKFNKSTKPMASSGDDKNEKMNDEDDEDDEDEDDFEEVEMANHHDNELHLSKLSREPIQVTINSKKAKKKLDMAAKMARMFKSLQKKFIIETIKSHLVCWLAHGFYLNNLISHPEICAFGLSFDLFKFENFQLKNFNKQTLNEMLNKIAKAVSFNKNDEFLTKNLPINVDTLKDAISNLTCKNYLHFILIILVMLRNMNIKARLCICFDVIPSNPDEPVKKSIKTSKKSLGSLGVNEEEEASEDDNEKKLESNKKPLKRKSDFNENMKLVESAKRVKSEEKKDEPADDGDDADTRNSNKRLSSKLAGIKIKTKNELIKDELMSQSSPESSSMSVSDDESVESKSKKRPAKKTKKSANSEDEYKPDENQNSDKDDEYKNESGKTVKKPRRNSKLQAKNRKILSEDNNDGDDNNEENLIDDTNAKNYWIEVYLEDEKTWISVEPHAMKFDCATYLEKRYEKQILYVCAFDNDNKVKDVTKRYASQWAHSTRLLRISHLEEKKLWWEKTLLYHQPLDINLDMEEEKQLKKMLMDKGLPVSLPEFKDHPLYVLKRHLLKFQSIYPENAQPAGYFRDEPVYSRDNLVTLHSRQTWLKFARIVKPFEKAYKIVKGRLKMSEYKMGRRDNPDLDLYGMWQTKQYEPPIADGGRVPRNEFGNVEMFQPNMLPIGCIHLKNMPNLNRVCKKLNIDCAAAVVGFDAHGGFSHAVYDGWIICEEYKETVIVAYEQEEFESNKKQIEKQKEKLWNNWKKLIKSVLIRERLKNKYNMDNTNNNNNNNNNNKRNGPTTTRPAKLTLDYINQLRKEIQQEEGEGEENEIKSKDIEKSNNEPSIQIKPKQQQQQTETNNLIKNVSNKKANKTNGNKTASSTSSRSNNNNNNKKSTKAKQRQNKKSSNYFNKDESDEDENNEQNDDEDEYNNEEKESNPTESESDPDYEFFKAKRRRSVKQKANNKTSQQKPPAKKKSSSLLKNEEKNNPTKHQMTTTTTTTTNKPTKNGDHDNDQDDDDDDLKLSESDDE